MLIEDVRAKALWLYGKASPRMVLRAWLSDATLCMVLYRLMALFNKWPCTRPFAFLFQKINAIFCGAVIGMNATFGQSLIILHSVGIVINSSVVCGNHIVLESGVVIGAEKGKSPRLGDNVFVGTGAKVVGGIEVGDNVTIGANAVVVKDVPDNAVVCGVPAKVVRIKNNQHPCLVGGIS